MNQKNLYRITGGIVFFLSLLVYLFTVQPSVSFWDCGEFIASSFLLQVPHPPGTPFFLILGRFFSFLPVAENIAFRINLISVLSSAFIVFFLYMVAVKLIENFQKREEKSLFEKGLTYAAAAIGALSLAFSDTFWFNALEAEVYALATFFIAIITYFMMVWHEKADEPDSEKYLIMIAYLVGISTGVHLMSVLAIVPIVMVITFRKYVDDEDFLKNTGYIFLGHSAILLLVAFGMWASQTGSTPPSPEQYSAVDSRFLWIFIGLSVIYIAAFWKKVFHKNSFYLPMFIGGIALFATYPGIVKHVPNLIAKFGKNNIYLDIAIFLMLFVIIGYLIYWTNKTNKMTLNLVFKCVLFVFIGFTSYAMIIIRANQDPPINLNSPKTFSEVVSYLNREQYGDAPIFQRRYTQEPHLQETLTDYSSDLDFLMTYQMNHMFNRYLMWNFVGRVSTVQDTGVDWSKLFGIPFFVGLFGVYFHFRKDWKLASVFLVMFIFLGYLTAFYQNQQQPQPRERDYFYVGAFFVFSIWIALGMQGILDLIKESLKNTTRLKIWHITVLALGLLLIPLNMLRSNYFDHDRSRNYVPWDYSYNLLQSAAKDAIIFTNGDNDTFPLWYLQDVEGVRQDVRIANLSLLNTPWYIKQLKNTEPHGAKKIKLNYSDNEIERLGVREWEPKEITLPVPKEVFEMDGVTDTTKINSGHIKWRMDHTANYGQYKVIRIQDLVVLDMIKANNWERPIYFAVTSSDDSKIGLNDYLIMEGLSFRITPKKLNNYYQSVDEKIMHAQLFDEPEGYSIDYKPGFKFRGLNDESIFFDENHIRLTLNYRNSYIRLALYYLYEKGDMENTIATLDKMEEKIPRAIIPMDYRLLNDVGNVYSAAGAEEKYIPIAREVEKIALQRLEENPSDLSSQYNPYRLLLEIYDNLKEYDKAVDILLRLQSVIPNDKNVELLLEKYRKLSKSDTTEVIPKLIN